LIISLAVWAEHLLTLAILNLCLNGNTVQTQIRVLVSTFGLS